MKTAIRSSALLIIIALAFFSCKAKPKELIVKKWDFVSVDNFDELAQTATSQDEANLFEEMRDNLSLLSWKFDKNMNYSRMTGDSTTGSGIYEIADGKLITHSLDSVSNEYDIIQLTKDSLTVNSSIEGIIIGLHFKAE